MEKDTSKLEAFANKDPSLEDIKSGKLDKETKEVTEEMNKGTDQFADKDMEIDDLQKLTAKADKEIENEEKLNAKNNKDGKDTDANNLAELDDLTKIDDVGVENMNTPRFKQGKNKQNVVAKQEKVTPKTVQEAEGPA